MPVEEDVVVRAVMLPLEADVDEEVVASDTSTPSFWQEVNNVRAPRPRVIHFFITHVFKVNASG